ncbi:MAG: hypothetical protein FOGNACKC_02090 [Anaerolineae bacterium]|nr:hypothetical protein [Anaerolineae bacterium]
MAINTIKKRQIAAAALFAAENIPGVDKKTLRRLLELVEVSGEFNWITRQELLEKMRLLLKYIPGSCRFSLLILAELLEAELSAFQPALVLAPAGSC